ncbi:MAG: type IV pilin protein, partial [Xanthomonadales bacterium]|nr:type IV pilin protein [Xanthomonadales bacterium]
MTHAHFDRIRRQRGITMIELMIVLAIVAILGAIAVPSYRDYVVRTNRSDAFNQLLELAACQERVYIKLNRYDDARCGLTGGTLTTNGGRYVITMTPANNNQTFTLTAAPQGAQANDTCGTMGLTDTGTRSAKGG